MGMKINFRLHSEMNYTDVGFDRFYYLQIEGLHTKYLK